jgi:hypothetical protein
VVLVLVQVVNSGTYDIHCNIRFFETAIGHHPCSVGIVTVKNIVIVDEFVG